MGYCTYGGKVVPGNDRAGCIGGGGNWVDDIAPIQRGGVQITDPRSQAYDEQVTSLFNNMPGVGMLGKAIPRIGARGVPKFTGQANTVQQAQRAAQPIQGPVQQKLTDIGRIGTTTPTKLQRLDNAVYKAGQYAGNNPIKATVAASSVGVPAYNMFNAGEPVTDKKVVQNNTPVNQQSPMLTKEQIKAKNIALMNAKNAGDTATVDAILKTGIKPADTSTGLLTPTVTGTTSIEADPTPEEVKAVAKGEDIPDSIWDKMQTKEYWMTGIEGGSGKWDNRLFRLGEMMEHMGTPLSKQGDSPSKRWSTASSAAAKLKAEVEKERLKADGKGSDLKSLTFPQFQGNFADNFESFKENGWIPFDDYTTEEMSNIMNKAWLVHQKQPSATIESILKALKDNKQI